MFDTAQIGLCSLPIFRIKKEKMKGMRKIKMWKLKDRETRDLSEERLE